MLIFEEKSIVKRNIQNNSGTATVSLLVNLVVICTFVVVSLILCIRLRTILFIYNLYNK